MVNIEVGDKIEKNCWCNGYKVFKTGVLTFSIE